MVPVGRHRPVGPCPGLPGPGFGGPGRM